MALVKVSGLDHIVVRCADVERSLTWYCDVLGLPGERVDEWRAGEVFFPSARIDDHTIIDLFPGERDGDNIDHFCIVIEPTDLGAVAASGAFEVLAGPDTRWGARGDGTSLYVRDPDGNTVELRYYGSVDGRD
jgi:catechol 2,3-dioxygenase-like lactoylglutathione lyase family enzyme